MKRIIGLLIIALLTALPFAAYASPTTSDASASKCLPWKDALGIAYSKFQMLPAYLAVTDEGLILGVLTNDKGEWLLISQPNQDIICILAHGSLWGTVPQAVIDGVLQRAGQQ